MAVPARPWIMAACGSGTARLFEVGQRARAVVGLEARAAAEQAQAGIGGPPLDRAVDQPSSAVAVPGLLVGARRRDHDPRAVPEPVRERAQQQRVGAAGVAVDEHHAQVVRGGGRVRVQAQRLLKGRLRLGEPPRLAQQDAFVVVRARGARAGVGPGRPRGGLGGAQVAEGAQPLQRFLRGGIGGRGARPR